MKSILGWLILAAVALPAAASETPLAYRKLTLNEAFSRPAGRGLSCPLLAAPVEKPAKVPRAASRYPLYGSFGLADGAGQWRTIVFRLDESQGTGLGYDLLLVDTDGDRDLTDETPVSKVGEMAMRFADGDVAQFGPFAFQDKVPGSSWEAVWGAELEIPDRAPLSSGAGRDQVLGTLTFRSAWLLEATVEVNGAKEKVGFLDGNCNLRLPDLPTMNRIPGGQDRPDRWHLAVSDFVLRSFPNPLKAGFAPYRTVEPWYEVLYLGGMPYSVTVNSNLTSVRVEPYAGPCAKLAWDARFDELVLARQREGDRWEPLSPRPVGDVFTLPTGGYRVGSYVLQASDTTGALYQARCMTGAEKIFQIAEGASAPLPFGPPFDLKVAALKQSRPDGAGMGIIRSLFAKPGNPTPTLALDLRITGAAQEPLVGFYRLTTNAAGGVRYRSMEPPRFRVLDVAGKQVAAGGFEFG